MDPVLAPQQFHDNRQAAVGNEGKGMRRVDGDRRQHRIELRGEVFVEPAAFAASHFVGADHRDAGLLHLVDQAEPFLLLPAHQLGDPLVDRRQLLGRRQTLGRGGLDTGAHLAAQAGHAHHEELIEIAGRDRQEPQPLEQGMIDVVGLFQHTLVEREPRDLPVDQALRGSEVDGGNLGTRRQVGFLLQGLHFQRYDLAFFHASHSHFRLPRIPSSRIACPNIADYDRYGTRWPKTGEISTRQRFGNGLL